MKNRLIFVLSLALAMTITGCGDIEPVEPVNKTDSEGRLIEISSMIDEVMARKSTPDPGDNPRQFYSLKFSDLGPGPFTIRMCIEREVNGEREMFDITEAPVSKNGRFTLEMPSSVQPGWLGTVYDEVERLIEKNYGSFVELNGVPDEIEISNPDAGMCIAGLYMERVLDGQRYYVYYEGFDKRLLHEMITDTSVVSSSLLYTAGNVSVEGEANIKYFPEEWYGDLREFGIASPGGWSWLHCVMNGMSEYAGWTTAYPEWAHMSYSARAIYED